MLSDLVTKADKKMLQISLCRYNTALSIAVCTRAPSRRRCVHRPIAFETQRSVVRVSTRRYLCCWRLVPACVRHQRPTAGVCMHDLTRPLPLLSPCPMQMLAAPYCLPCACSFAPVSFDVLADITMSGGRGKGGCSTTAAAAEQQQRNSSFGCSSYGSLTCCCRICREG